MLLIVIAATLESTSIVVAIPSFAPPILTILDLVLDVVIAGEGGTKGGTTKSREAWA